MEHKEQTEFNSAFQFIARLNGWLYLAGEASYHLDAHNWFNAIRQLYKELSTYMNDVKRQELKKSISKINELMKDYINKRERGHNEIKPELYKLLEDLEIDLRFVMKESGLDMKMKEDWTSSDEDWN